MPFLLLSFHQKSYRKPSHAYRNAQFLFAVSISYVVFRASSLVVHSPSWVFLISSAVQLTIVGLLHFPKSLLISSGPSSFLVLTLFDHASLYFSIALSMVVVVFCAALLSCPWSALYFPLLVRLFHGFPCLSLVYVQVVLGKGRTMNEKQKAKKTT